jgi:hypothetical protein
MSVLTDRDTGDSGEPDASTDPLTGSEMTAIAQDRIEALGISLAARRDEWIQAKQASGVEKRWIEDLDQYMGRDEATKQTATMMDSAEAGYPITNKGAKPQRSTVFVNITRPKTNTAEARLSNMLFPTDDRNFGLKPSPVPALTALAKKQAEQKAMALMPPQPGMPPQGQPGQPPANPMAAPQPPGQPPQPPMQGGATAPQADPQTIDAQAKLEEAAECSKAMELEVDDQLAECNYNAECRKLIHEAAVIGTGVMCGPILVNRKTKTWTPVSDGHNTVHVLEITSDIKPASEFVSPWDIVTDPSCGNDAHAGSGIFRKRAYTSKQLRELAKQPNYLKDGIGKAIAQGPQIPEYMSERDKKELKSQSALPFEAWEYWGEFNPDDMRAAGVDMPDDSTEMVSGCVIICNDIVIKGFLNPNETGDLPFNFFVWEPDSNSVWGYGVPYMCKPAQRVLNAAWRQLMDNSGLAMGPQIIVNRKAIQPIDGRWEIVGRKLWELVDQGVDAKAAFSSVEFNNHGTEIQQIIELALKFVDLETSIPQLEQGEHANAPDTLGGMVIQQNSTNIVLGRLTKCFDDNITTPHIGRYVDWNMAYNEKPEIKGDHNVMARGTSALLVRDIQNQALLSLGQFQGSPIVGPMVRWEEWFKACLKAQHIDAASIMKTDAEIAALANQPSQPPLPVVLEQMKGQNNIQAIAAKSQASMQELAAEAQQEQQMLQNGQATPHMAMATARIEDSKIRANTSVVVETSRANAEQARAQKELEIAQQNGQMKIQELALKKEIALLDYSNQQKISLDQSKVQLATSQMDNQTKRDLASAEIALSQSESAHDRNLDLHKHNTSLIRDEMSTPNTP